VSRGEYGGGGSILVSPGEVAMRLRGRIFLSVK